MGIFFLKPNKGGNRDQDGFIREHMFVAFKLENAWGADWSLKRKRVSIFLNDISCVFGRLFLIGHGFEKPTC